MYSKKPERLEAEEGASIREIAACPHHDVLAFASVLSKLCSICIVLGRWRRDGVYGGAEEGGKGISRKHPKVGKVPVPTAKKQKCFSVRYLSFTFVQDSVQCFVTATPVHGASVRNRRTAARALARRCWTLFTVKVQGSWAEIFYYTST